MHAVSVTVFWLSVAWLGYIYVGYAAVLWVLGRVRPEHHETAMENFFPSISVLISARNEEHDIGWKVKETLGWDYPADRLQVLVASDASDDGTDRILEAVRDPRFQFVRMEKRGGKNIALERLAKLATGDLLFFSDANSHVASECVHNIVRHFADPKVGCVTGVERSIHAQQQEAIASGGGVYLGYEAWLNTLESRLGSVLVCDGSIYCARRELFDSLDPELANDLEQPVKIGACGYKVLYEPQAFSSERATSSAKQEFTRRRRICGQGILGMWRLRSQLRGLRLWQFISRKLLRWLTLIPLIAALAVSLVLARAPLFAIAALGQIVFYVLALLGWAWTSAGREGAKIIFIPFYYVLVNVAAFVGLLDTFSGRRYGVWDVATLSRGQGRRANAEASHA